MGEPYVEDFNQLIAQLCDEHLDHFSSSYALFGHSMGALLAYGIAQRLQYLQQPLPKLLFASASPAPSYRDANFYVNKLSDADLIADLHEQGGTPEEIFANAELLQLTLHTLRADYKVCASFNYGAPQLLPLPIHVFAGRQDGIATDRLMAWSKEAGGGFQLQMYDGGHFFIRQHESAVVAAVVREISRCSGTYARQSVPVAGR